MSSPTKILIAISLIVRIATNAATANPQQTRPEHGMVEFANSFKIEVEIAATLQQREQGLMHRTSLAENQGMLFVHPFEADQRMWMKNMLIDLDVLFISEHGQVTSILHHLRACKQPPCPIYSSNAKAKYMLEVNAGFVERHSITPGQELIIDYRHD